MKKMLFRIPITIIFFAIAITVGLTDNAYGSQVPPTANFKVSLNSRFLGFGETSFSLALKEYKKELFQEIAQFGQGIVPLVVSPQSARGGDEKQTLRVGLIKRELSSLRRNLAKALSADGKDHENQEQLPESAQLAQEQFEKVLEQLVVCDFADILKQAALIATINGRRDDRFNYLVRTIIAHSMLVASQVSLEPIKKSLEQKEKELSHEKEKQKQNILKLEELQISQKEDTQKFEEEKMRLMDQNLLQQQKILGARLELLDQRLLEQKHYCTEKIVALQKRLARLQITNTSNQVKP